MESKEKLVGRPSGLFSRGEVFLNVCWILLILGAMYGTISFIGIDDLQSTVETIGIWGPLVLIFAKISTLVFAPLGGAPLYPIAGAAFGPLEGFIYIFIGDAIGASLCFFISRKFGRTIATRFISRHGMQFVE